MKLIGHGIGCMTVNLNFGLFPRECFDTHAPTPDRVLAQRVESAL